MKVRFDLTILTDILVCRSNVESSLNTYYDVLYSTFLSSFCCTSVYLCFVTAAFRRRAYSWSMGMGNARFAIEGGGVEPPDCNSPLYPRSFNYQPLTGKTMLSAVYV